MRDSALHYDCPDCNERTVRRFTTPNIQTEGEQIPYLHPAFGTVMTDRQARDEAKRRGFVEVGDDRQESITPPKPKNYDSNDYFL